eukprot:6904870-Lingulodinium_polyedra.AAC.1
MVSTAVEAGRPADKRKHVSDRPLLRPAGRPTSASMFQIDLCFGRRAGRSTGRFATCWRCSAGRLAEGT